MIISKKGLQLNYTYDIFIISKIIFDYLISNVYCQ